jgi:hypothetical protein
LVANGLDDVARPHLALGTDHGRSFACAAQSLAGIARAADKGHFEPVFVDVVFVIGAVVSTSDSSM